MLNLFKFHAPVRTAPVRTSHFFIFGAPHRTSDLKSHGRTAPHQRSEKTAAHRTGAHQENFENFEP